MTFIESSEYKAVRAALSGHYPRAEKVLGCHQELEAVAESLYTERASAARVTALSLGSSFIDHPSDATTFHRTVLIDHGPSDLSGDRAAARIKVVNEPAVGSH